MYTTHTRMEHVATVEYAPASNRTKAVVGCGDESHTNGIFPIGVHELLKRSGVSPGSIFMNGRSLKRYGICVFATRVSASASMKALTAVYNHYPVTDGRIKDMGVMAFELKHLRGYLAFGDRGDLARFWFDLFIGRVDLISTDFTRMAMSWTAFGSGGYHPYIDFDELGKTAQFIFSINFLSHLKKFLSLISSLN